MPGRRGARTGRGWDAAPPRPPRARRPSKPATTSGWAPAGPDDLLWTPEEAGYQPGQPRGGQHDSEPVESTPDPDGGDGRYADAGRSGRRTGSGANGRSRRDDTDEAGTGAAASGPRAGEPGRSRGRGRWGEPAPADETRDPAEVAREICLRQLAVRPRTRAELAAALARRGIEAEVAASVLDRYDEVGIIDDAAFARAWVTSRHHGRGLASRALASELRRKGVEKELADAALDELDDETEAGTARELVDRKLRSAGRTAPDALFRRMVGMLARKGYPPGLAIRVVKDALAARADDVDFLEEIDPDATAHLVGEEPGADQPID